MSRKCEHGLAARGCCFADRNLKCFRLAFVVKTRLVSLIKNESSVVMCVYVLVMSLSSRHVVVVASCSCRHVVVAASFRCRWVVLLSSRHVVVVVMCVCVVVMYVCCALSCRRCVVVMSLSWLQQVLPRMSNTFPHVTEEVGSPFS